MALTQKYNQLSQEQAKLTEKLEQQRHEKELVKKQLEKEQLEKKQLEKEQLEKEQLEKEQLEKERHDKNRLDRERHEELQSSGDFLIQFDGPYPPCRVFKDTLESRWKFFSVFKNSPAAHKLLVPHSTF